MNSRRNWQIVQIVLYTFLMLMSASFAAVSLSWKKLHERGSRLMMQNPHLGLEEDQPKSNQKADNCPEAEVSGDAEYWDTPFRTRGLMTVNGYETSFVVCGRTRKSRY